MGSPLQITFKDIATSAVMEEKIREHAQKVRKYHPDPLELHVVVAQPHHHSHKAAVFVITISAHVKGRTLMVNSAGDKDHSHEDPYVALHDAFRTLQRELTDHTQIRNGT